MTFKSLILTHIKVHKFGFILSRKNNTLLIIAGPTAVGKTDLCINLAKKFNTCIVSADSRQFFNEIKIGTAKPTENELSQAKHYLINSLSIKEDYDVGKFEKEALALLDGLFQKYNMVILSGGSGLYLDAVAHGLDDIPGVDETIRDRLNEEFKSGGLKLLQEKLLEIDPEYYKTVDLNNPHRIIRALQVSQSTGTPFSSFRIKKKVKRPFKIVKIALERQREELYERINQRMDQMIKNGLFEEAESLYQWRHYNALNTVGYKEIFPFLEGIYDKEEAIRLLKRNSRRYAKRQLTWFRKDPAYHWFHPSREEEIIEFVRGQIGIGE
jgi:tRNA dimethylallyltransferase